MSMGIISFKNERIYYKGDLFTVILGPYSKHKFLCKISSDSRRCIPGRCYSWQVPYYCGYLRKIK